MSAAAYTRAASYYHWMVAAPLIGSIGCVLKAQDTPKEQKKEKMNWMWRHKSLGVLTGLVVLPRVGYRLVNAGKYQISKLPGDGPVMSALATAGHYGLYAFMTIMPASGIAMGMYGGKGLPFFWTTIPGFEQKNGKLAGQVCSKTSVVYSKLSVSPNIYVHYYSSIEFVFRVTKSTNLLVNTENFWYQFMLEPQLDTLQLDKRFLLELTLFVGHQNIDLHPQILDIQ